MGRGGGEDLWGPKTRTRLVRTAPVGCANYDRMELRTRQPNAGRRRDVASLGIRPRTQNGHINGKEGVDGSSPSEGFVKMPANGTFLRLGCKRAVTRGHSRALRHVRTACAHAVGFGLTKRV